MQNDDGTRPAEQTTWDTSMDLETNYNGVASIDLCFKPDYTTMTYSIEAKVLYGTSCGTDGSFSTADKSQYGYLDTLPPIVEANQAE